MIVLGIDPGIGITGAAVVSEEKGQLHLIDCLALTTPKNVSLDQRLIVLHDKLKEFIAQTHPQAAALETLFFHTNVTTAFSVGQAKGVIQLILAQAKIPITEYSPAAVKMSVTGSGNAPKNQIQKMVSRILRLPKTLTPDDVADAAAIALTHLFSYKLNQKTFNK